jgi:hypothetical protein
MDTLGSFATSPWQGTSGRRWRNHSRRCHVVTIPFLVSAMDDSEARLAGLQTRIAARREKRKLQDVDGEPASSPAKAVRFSSQEISATPHAPQDAAVLPSKPAIAATPTSDVPSSKPKTKAKQRYLKRKTERRKAKKKSGDKPANTEKAKERGEPSEERIETPEERQARKKAAKEAKRAAKEQQKASEQQVTQDQEEEEDDEETEASDAESSGSGSEASETSEVPRARKRRKKEERGSDDLENSTTVEQQEPESSGDVPVDSISDSKAARVSSPSPPPLQRFALPKQPAGPSATLLAELAIPSELSDTSAHLVSPSLTVHVDSVPELSDEVRNRLKDGGISDFFAGALITYRDGHAMQPYEPL